MTRVQAGAPGPSRLGCTQPLLQNVPRIHTEENLYPLYVHRAEAAKAANTGNYTRATLPRDDFAALSTQRSFDELKSLGIDL